ncbi:MAG: GDP-L-fucose synthase [Gammaproteobacteria bacterium]|nr:GDP-L-fucose synthase [Gammaproteobacteria bacterium]
MTMTQINHTSKIFVAGHRGMVGSAIVRCLQQANYTNLILRDRAALDLTNQQAVDDFFQTEKPDMVFLAAARVGGVYANNTYRAEFIYENLAIALNVVNAAWKAGVERLVFLGSSCIYPRECPQPIIEDYLLSSSLEQTNEPYAIAKIAGIKLCESYNRQYGTSYVSLMPTNLYGPNDNYDLKTSHVLPALIRKAHQAKINGEKELVVWGSGNPKREFLHVDDMAAACVYVMEKGVREGVYNVGCGQDTSIKEVAELVMNVVGCEAKIVFDSSKPDGSPRKWLNIDKMRKLGWAPKVDLAVGLSNTYQDFLNREAYYCDKSHTAIPALA